MLPKMSRAANNLPSQGRNSDMWHNPEPNLISPHFKDNKSLDNTHTHPTWSAWILAEMTRLYVWAYIHHHKWIHFKKHYIDKFVNTSTNLKPKLQSLLTKNKQDIVQEHIFFSFNTPKHIHSPMNKHMIFPAQSLSSLMNAQ